MQVLSGELHRAGNQNGKNYLDLLSPFIVGHLLQGILYTILCICIYIILYVVTKRETLLVRNPKMWRRAMWGRKLMSLRINKPWEGATETNTAPWTFDPAQRSLAQTQWFWSSTSATGEQVIVRMEVSLFSWASLVSPSQPPERTASIPCG